MKSSWFEVEWSLLSLSLSLVVCYVIFCVGYHWGLLLFNENIGRVQRQSILLNLWRTWISIRLINSWMRRWVLRYIDVSVSPLFLSLLKLGIFFQIEIHLCLISGVWLIGGCSSTSLSPYLSVNWPWVIIFNSVWVADWSDVLVVLHNSWIVFSMHFVIHIISNLTIKAKFISY